MKDLPQDWAVEPLGVASDLSMGQSPSGSATNTAAVGVPLIGGAGDYTGSTLRASRYTTKPTKVCVPGDLVLCIRATIGKIAVADQSYCLGRGVAGVRARLVDSDYLRYYLSSQADALEEAGTGTTFRQIDKKTLSEWPVPVPPTAAQRHIVRRLNELLRRPATARRELARLAGLLERFRAAILERAFHDPVWPSALLHEVVQNARGIPYGIVQTGEPDASGVATVRAGDIKKFAINVDGLKKVAPIIEAEYRRTRLTGGEVLISIRGTVGNVAVVPPSMAGCNISREVAMIPPADVIRPTFLMFFLATPAAQQAVRKQVKGVAQSGINLADLRMLRVPIPPIAVQRAVEESLSTSMKMIEQMERESLRATALLGRLEQATLAKAFRGELTDEAASESASVAGRHSTSPATPRRAGGDAA